MKVLRYLLSSTTIVAASMSLGAYLSGSEEVRRIISDGGLAVGVIALVGTILLFTATLFDGGLVEGEAQSDERLAAALWNRNGGLWGEWDIYPWPAPNPTTLHSASYKATVRSGGVEEFDADAEVTASGALPRTIALSVTDTQMTLVRVDEPSEEAGDARS